MQSKGVQKRAAVRAVWIGLGLLCVLIRPVSAARIGPDPVIRQFLQGYGIVAAEVDRADHVVLDPKQRYPAYYDVTFRVREVVAQPIKGDPFPLKRGDTFVVRATMGYACAIEDRLASPHKLGPVRPGGPLAAGAKYYVSVKFDPDKGAYALANGASILTPVRTFTDDQAQDIRIQHGLAAMTAADRVRRCYGLLLDPKTSRVVRLAALTETRQRAWRAREADAAERRATAELYWKIWRGDTSHWDDESLSSLDHAMRVTPGDAFTNSAARRDLWLARMFAPMGHLTRKEQGLECIRRNNQLGWVVVEVGMIHPEIVGARMIREMQDGVWPTDFYANLLRYLLLLYRRVETPPKTWEAFLQENIPGLIDRSPSWPLRLIADSLKRALAKPDPKRYRRSFKPGPKTIDALKRALERERRLAESNPKAPSAVHDIDRFLKMFREQP